MAFYIDIIKIGEENDLFAYYSYQFSKPVREIKSSTGKIRYETEIVKGSLRINKKSGDVKVLSFADGDNGTYADRASMALIKHWNNGEFPEKTCWAS